MIRDAADASTSSKPTPFDPSEPAESTPVSPAQIRADFHALGKALRSLDLTEARKTFAILEAESPRIAQAVSGPRNLDNLPFQSLAGALLTGNVTAAQAAFAAIQHAAAKKLLGTRIARPALRYC